MDGKWKRSIKDAVRQELSNSSADTPLLQEYHGVFSLDKEDRGETDLVDTTPRRYLVPRFLLLLGRLRTICVKCKPMG